MTKKILFSFIGLMMLNLSAQMKIDTLSIENYQIRTLKISENLDEISSLEFYKDFNWGINDIVEKEEIYKIDPKSGKIVKIVKIRNAFIVDWEEFAFSDQYVFIGVFGTNLGIRKDQRFIIFRLRN